MREGLCARIERVRFDGADRGRKIDWHAKQFRRCSHRLRYSQQICQRADFSEGLSDPHGHPFQFIADIHTFLHRVHSYHLFL